jgi:hypothetical protein
MLGAREMEEGAGIKLATIEPMVPGFWIDKAGRYSTGRNMSAQARAPTLPDCVSKSISTYPRGDMRPKLIKFPRREERRRSWTGLSSGNGVNERSCEGGGGGFAIHSSPLFCSTGVTRELYLGGTCMLAASVAVQHRLFCSSNRRDGGGRERECLTAIKSTSCC